MRNKILSIFLLITISVSLANSLDNVSVLTWWGYLDKPWINKEIKKKCNVNLIYQNYMDNDDFNALLPSYKWDMVIFESTILNTIKNKIKRDNIDDSYILKKYPQFIKKQFLRETHGNIKNITYFTIASTVFLYNPKVIDINYKDSISTIIKKLKESKSNKDFILIDDANSIDAIMHAEDKCVLNIKNFKEIFNYKNLVVQNSYEDYNNLGVMLTWSGIALKRLKEAKKKGIDLKIIMLPKYSFTSSDYIAKLSSNPRVSCVFEYLTSNNFLMRLNSDAFYFSPYVYFKSIKDTDLKDEYYKFYELGTNNQLNWLYLSTEKEKMIYKSWSNILAELGL